MLELLEKEISFKFKEETHTIKEPTVETLERIEAIVKKDDLSEMAFYVLMMKECGLDESVARQLSLRHLRQLMEEIKKVK